MLPGCKGGRGAGLKVEVGDKFNAGIRRWKSKLVEGGHGFEGMDWELRWKRAALMRAAFFCQDYSQRIVRSCYLGWFIL